MSEYTCPYCGGELSPVDVEVSRSFLGLEDYYLRSVVCPGCDRDVSVRVDAQAAYAIEGAWMPARGEAQ